MGIDKYFIGKIVIEDLPLLKSKSESGLEKMNAEHMRNLIKEAHKSSIRRLRDVQVWSKTSEQNKALKWAKIKWKAEMRKTNPLFTNKSDFHTQKAKLWY